ncbi:YggS family pyridoxal phosphate-dependent enzyme [Mucispirillum schaedleri]|uniref:Pyridoxal phosphate homeostasis protein n=1 Tax=Mucispirillum schaedleri ASF457 TaxID=1379858 RepID=V2RIM4_9BACT|nr:YggS family pyridoxal phosphate-dependent enzyme [Mucispirillum schaedleri]MCX4360010.1 YggS family pyridoxal phosphate-dependent enzyme [Mucispirillum schaedleri]USF23240.1 Pyridoxal phosphate homeostasis protein [Mucispirillum schaedleri ASF457]SIW05010.1 YggS family pyridoxal phosphate enzyme [Mucispirillum schaedleri ASF457]
MSVIENYNEILNSVKEVSKQANHHVDILAVSKTQCVEKMTELALNNVKMFGESKVQEAVPKIEYLSSKYNDLEFHFIGKVQTNKLKKIVEYFSLIHSVDRLDVLPLIDKYAHELNKKQNILIQINIAYEMQKNGIDPVLLDDIIKSALDYKNITLKGLMFMPPYEEDVTKNIPYFKQAAALFYKYKNDTFNILSMGMSHDFKEAVMCGATLVRVGTSIFGERV